MRRLLAPALVMLLTVASAHAGDLLDDVWRGTVRLDRKVTVPAGKTLTIAPGTTVIVRKRRTRRDDYRRSRERPVIEVRGTLMAVGTAAEPIRFRNEESVWWGGIRFIGKTAGGTISHCEITNGAIACNGASPTIVNNHMVDLDRSSGITCTNGASPQIIGNRFRLARRNITGFRYHAVTVNDASPILTGNTFEGYGLCIKVAAGSVRKPVVSGSRCDADALIVLDEDAPNHLTLHKVLRTGHVGQIQQVAAAERDGGVSVAVNGKYADYRLHYSKDGRYALHLVARKAQAQGVHEIRAMPLYTAFSSRKDVRLAAMVCPTVRRAGRKGRATNCYIVVVYDPRARGGQVRWISEPFVREGPSVLATDLNGDGADELVVPLNDWRDDSRGAVVVYATTGVGGGPRRMSKNKIPADLPKKVRRQVLGLYAADAAVRAEAADRLGSAEDTARVVPFLVAMLDDGEEVPSGVRKGSTPANWASTSLVRIGAPAVKALAKAGTDSNVVVSQNALGALEKIDDPKATEMLVALAEDKNVMLRRAAVVALGRLKDPKLIPVLFRALGDEDKRVFLRARKVLSGFKPTVGVEPLVAVMKHKDPRVRKGGVELLLYMMREPEAEAALIAAAADPDADVRRQTIRPLDRIDTPAATAALAGMLTDTEADIRLAAAHELATRHDKRSVPVLEAFLKDKDPKLRKRAMYGLRWSKAPKAATLIVPMLHDADPSVRRGAAQVLGEIEDPAAVPALIDAMKRKHIDVDNLARALKVIGKASPEVLLPLLRGKDVEVRRVTAMALGQGSLYRQQGTYYNDPRLVDALVMTMNSADAETRKFSAVALGNLHDPAAGKALAKALANPALDVGAEAAEALGKLKSPEAVEPLIEALSHKDLDVRRHAAVALGDIGDDRAADVLIAALAADDETLRYNAADALEAITGQALGEDHARWQAWLDRVRKPPESVAALSALLDDPRDDVRRRAIMALGEKRTREAAAVLVERFVNRTGGSSRGRAVYKVDGMHWRDREHVFAALVKTGEPAIDLLIPVASYGWTIKKPAAEIIARAGDVAVPHLLRAWENSKDRETRRGAAKVLGRLKPHEAILPLLKGVGPDRHRGVTQDAWPALAAYDADALPVFQGALHDPALPKHQRKAAAVMCAHFGDISGWAMLEEAVTKGNSGEMNWTCSQMGHLRNELFLPLIGKGLARKDAGQSITHYAAFCGGKKAIPMLTKALKHPNPAVRSGAASYLKMLSKNK